MYLLPQPFTLSHGSGAIRGFVSLNPRPRVVKALLEDISTSTDPFAGRAKLSLSAGGLSRFPCHHLGIISVVLACSLEI